MSLFSALPLVIEPSDLQERLHAPELILVDLCSDARYLEGHIPGARHITPQRTQCTGSPTPGYAPALDELNALFSQLGHHQDATYVVYDDEGGGWAGRFIWLLDVIGHTRYHYLNGGLCAWLAEHRPLSQEPPQVLASEVALSIHQAPTASLEYLKSRLGQADLVVWDARSEAEYSGAKVLAARGGHIPGAVNFEWTKGMDPDNALRIRSDLAETLASLGISQEHEIITHCQTHRRSGFTYLAAKALGFNRVKAYAGSWSEWGNQPDTPIEVSA